MDYTFQFGDVLDQWPLLLWGAGLTVTLSLTAMVLGLVLAIGLALVLVHRRRGPARIITVYVEVIRNTPFLIQVMFVYFALPSLGLRLNPVPASLAALTIYVSAYATEIVRAGLHAVPGGQIDAARALGLRPYQVTGLIELPHALRVTYPALTSQFILVMLSSSIVSVISTDELTGVADTINSITFRTIETYLVITLIYFAISASLYGGFRLAARLAGLQGPMGAGRNRVA